MDLNNIDKLVQNQEVDKETTQQMDAYTMALMQVIHSDQTGGSMVEMLKSAPPEQSIPMAAMEANNLVESALKNQGVEPKDEVKMAGAIYLVSDLAELGNAAQIWDKPVDKEVMPSLFQETLTKYIHKGLADGSIDPVELQAQTEPLLNDTQKEVGVTSAAALGLPTSPTADMGIDEYTRRQTKPLEDENKKLKGMLQKGQMQAQAQQGQPQGGPQGQPQGGAR